MAGTDPAFDATLFRTSIRYAMQMGEPTDTAQQITFRFKEQATYGTADPAGNPYDWTAAPSAETAVRDVRVPASVTWSGQGTMAENALGEFDTSRGTVTVLDEDFSQVQGFDEILIGSYHYDVDPPGPMPQGLFDVTVWTIHISARG